MRPGGKAALPRHFLRRLWLTPPEQATLTPPQITRDYPRLPEIRRRSPSRQTSPTDRWARHQPSRATPRCASRRAAAVLPPPPYPRPLPSPRGPRLVRCHIGPLLGRTCEGRRRRGVGSPPSSPLPPPSPPSRSSCSRSRRSRASPSFSAPRARPPPPSRPPRLPASLGALPRRVPSAYLLAHWPRAEKSARHSPAAAAGGEKTRERNR